MKAQPSSIRMLPEQTVLSAWREQLAQATPGLSQTLLGQQPELLPRFAAYYSQLQQLPRRARRGLQRQIVSAGINPPANANDSAPRPHEFGPTISDCKRGEDSSFTPSAPLSRSLRRQWQRSLAGAAVLLALGQAPALAATINVSGGCTLADAITGANTDSAVGLCTEGGDADRLVLTPGSTHTLTTANNSTPYGPTGLPVIESAITIAGNGSTITRASTAPAFRILAVGALGNLTVRDTTISGGKTSGQDISSFGGGVLIRAGALTLANSTVSRNTASQGGGVDNGQGGTLTVTNSTLSSNSASGGGGVHVGGSTAILTESTISGNLSSLGGGMNISGGSVTLTNSTLSGNSAAAYGGGVANYLGKLSIINSTVSRNVVGPNGPDGKGGGVLSTGGKYTSQKGELVLSRAIISGNQAFQGAEVFRGDGSLISLNNFNLFGHSGLTSSQALAGFTPGALDITATADAGAFTLTSILNPTLANNGGLTQTHALVAGSPAIEGAGACTPKDQRGVPRPQDGNNDGFPICDIGAFESVRPGAVTCDKLPATIIGTAASQTLTGTTSVDVIQGLGGNDLIKGVGGNDVLCGSLGNDQVQGGTGDDRLFGEQDKDNLNGETGFDRCDGGSATTDTAVSCEQVSNVP